MTFWFSFSIASLFRIWVYLRSRNWHVHL